MTEKLPPIPPGMEDRFRTTRDGENLVRIPRPLGDDYWQPACDLTGPAREMFSAWMMERLQKEYREGRMKWADMAHAQNAWREWMEVAHG